MNDAALRDKILKAQKIIKKIANLKHKKALQHKLLKEQWRIHFLNRQEDELLMDHDMMDLKEAWNAIENAANAATMF